MVPAYAKAFTYYVPWKSNSLRSGDHQGTQRGLGFEFRGNVPLLDYPDPRRLDIRQTVRDPFESIQVRVFNQDNTTPIFAVCDLSGSMQFGNRHKKLEMAQSIAASIVLSAEEQGDLCSLIGYDKHVREEMSLPLSASAHAAYELIDMFGSYDTTSQSSEGILEVPQYISQTRALVFWISDFHMPIHVIEQVMNMLSGHQIVPIVLWDDDEYVNLPTFGFGTLIDPETGADRTIFFRKDLRERFISGFMERKQQLDRLFLDFDCPPVFIKDEFHPLQMTEYFEQWVGA